MANRKKSKGFTIVELVIVIAVIAILAAVLIPTFSSLINKANITSDQSAVRNMNTALAASEADGKPENLTDVLNILGDAGMDAKDYKALAKGYKFVWDSTLNRVLYVEDATNKVTYPEQYAENEYVWGTWVTLTGQIAGDDSWKVQVNTGDKENLTYESFRTDETIKSGYFAENGEIKGAKVSGASELISVVETIAEQRKQSAATQDMDIILADNIDLMGSEWKPIAEFNGSFYGNGKEIAGFRMSDRTADSKEIPAASQNSNYSFYGFVSIFTGKYFGDVTIYADIDEPGSGKQTTSGFDLNNQTVAAAIGGIYASGGTDDSNKINVTVENVKVYGTVVGYNRVAGVVGYIGGHADDASSQGALPTGSVVTIKNCENHAEIISSAASHGSYATAAGILSVTNQRASNTEINITGCKNDGAIRGQWAAGIMADSWASNVKKEGEAGYDNYRDAGTITIDDCLNEGTVTGEIKSTTSNNQSVRVGGIYGKYNGGTDKGYYTVIVKNCTNKGELKLMDNRTQGNNHPVYIGSIAAYCAGETVSSSDGTYALKLEGNTNSGTISCAADEGKKIYINDASDGIPSAANS